MDALASPLLFGRTVATSNCGFGPSLLTTCAAATDISKGKTKSENRMELMSLLRNLFAVVNTHSGMGRAAESTTRTSIGPRAGCSLRPSCSCTAVKIDGAPLSGAASGDHVSVKSIGPALPVLSTTVRRTQSDIV